MFGQAKDKRVIVVGGGQQDGPSTGNGRAISVVFARLGANVVVVDRDLARAEATVAQIEKEGYRAHAFAADVGKSADCARLVEQAQFNPFAGLGEHGEVGTPPVPRRT